MGEAHKRHAINSLKGSSTLQTVKDKPTHTLKRTHWHTYRHNKTPNVHEYALTPALFSLLILISLISNHIFLQHLTVSFCIPKQWDSQSHTQAHRHIHKVYWTLRVRADTPWCQSLSSLYLGPITNRVVLFTLPSSTSKKKKEEEEKDTRRDIEEWFRKNRNVALQSALRCGKSNCIIDMGSTDLYHVHWIMAISMNWMEQTTQLHSHSELSVC